MKSIVCFMCAFGLLLLAGGSTHADEKKTGKESRYESFATRLSSFNEVHFNAGNATTPPSLRGAISSGAKGTFKAVLDKTANLINYELSFEALESDVTQAHIHFGQRGTVGGIVVWLCETTANPAPATVAALTPDCFSANPRANTVTGTIAPSQVLAPTGQGFIVGDFEKLLAALRAGVTYANIHTATYGPGEIRGQVRRVRHDD